MILKPLIDRINDIRFKWSELAAPSNARADFAALNLIFKTTDAEYIPLSLGQFIPVGKDGKPLEKPEKSEWGFTLKDDEWCTSNENVYENHCYFELQREYQQAEAKCIFKGWESVEGTDSIRHENITFRFMKDNQHDCAGSINGKVKMQIYSYSTIEDISHLNLPLTNQGKEQIL